MKNKLLILLIVLFGFALRFWQISKIPPGLSNDEISIAYEAYSIINTARDSTGKFLPISFKSHNDYKAPLYIYIASPFIKIFGNNEIAVRLPSVIFGTLTIWGIYLLSKKLGLGQKGAMLSAFLLAITPWHVYTSRIGLESNLALCILVFGVYFFLLGISKRKYFLLSSILLGLSLYAYHTERIFTPLLLISLTWIYFREFKTRKDIFIFWLTFLIFVAPIAIDSIFFSGGTRAGTEIFLKDFILGNKVAGVGNVFFKGYIFFSFWLDKYLQYMNPAYIFGHGLPVNAPYGSSDFGLLNIVQFPLFLLGVVYLFELKSKKTGLVLLVWCLVGPLVPSLTLGELNFIRNLVTVIPLTLISACGIVWILGKTGSKPLVVLCLAVTLINFAFFYRYYLIYFPKYFSENWSYGFKETALYAKEHQEKYKKIVFDYQYGTDVDLYGAPSLFFLYFNKINPSQFLEEAKLGDFLSFEKYEFRRVDWPGEEINPETLYIVGARSNPVQNNMLFQKVKEIHSVNLLDGRKAFKFYESY